ncbi:MAG: DUF2817 domain-containing protein, partial [Clostridia bacterium]|nr:DUF2817 domain-containing protein [Clostridia bacterium]
DPGTVTGRGYEQTAMPIKNHNDEVLEKVIPSDPKLWPQYRDLFITPGLDENKREQVATQEEMMFFLRKTVIPGKNGYLFTAGRSGAYQYEIPAAIFTTTDLRGAESLEDAAAILKKNRKLTVHYQAQIHGNEAAAGEGAMAMIAAITGEKGKAWLRDMDIIVIPRINPDGARAYIRNEVALNINLNRDFILCEAAETRAVQKVYQLFRPDVLIDGHEYTRLPGPRTGPFDDLMLGVAAGINNGKAIGKLNLDLLIDAFARVQEDGFRVTTYPDAPYETKICVCNAMDPSTGRQYFGLLGTLTILIETPANKMGKQAYLRRVAGHISTVHAILNFAAANKEAICRVVKEERAHIREAGRRYDPDRKFVLTTDLSKNEETALSVRRPLFDLATGDVIDENHVGKMYFFDTALRSRPYPTAYVLPKGFAWEEKVLEILRCNGIRAGEIPAGECAVLRQYIGSAKRAFLTEEKNVRFPRGAIVIPLAQETGILIATLLEPDGSDATDGKGSLAQNKIIEPSEGAFPVYRSERDLPEGRIPG